MLRNTASWQLILADLSLILFLVTAAALTASYGVSLDAAAKAKPEGDMAAAQSLYRAEPDVPSLREWLEGQPRDPRASLTIVAQYVSGNEDLAWKKAQGMAASVQELDLRVRVIIREGSVDDLYASYAYDQLAE